MRFIGVHQKNRTLVVKDEIKLKKDATFKIKDWRGFTLLTIDSSGNLKVKGTMGKI